MLKDPLQGFTIFDKSNELSDLRKAITQNNETLSVSGSTILRSEGPKLGLVSAHALTPLLSIKEMCKQFMKTYMEMVQNQAQS